MRNFLIEPTGIQIIVHLFVTCVRLRFFRESSLPATEGYSMDFDENRSRYSRDTDSPAQSQFQLG